MSSDQGGVVYLTEFRVIGTRHMGYASAVAALRDGEELYAIHDQVIRQVPVLLRSEEDWKHTDDQYGTGLSVDYFFAAALEEEA